MSPVHALMSDVHVMTDGPVSLMSVAPSVVRDVAPRGPMRRRVESGSTVRAVVVAWSGESPAPRARSRTDTGDCSTVASTSSTLHDSGPSESTASMSRYVIAPAVPGMLCESGWGPE